MQLKSLESLDLEQVKVLGSLNYTPKEIAVIMELDYDDVSQAMEDKNSEFYRHYMGGFYETDIKVRKSIFKLAEAGSSPAQTLAIKIIEQNDTKRNNEQ